ncbi:MAG: efflux RND transporter permease subunit [Myxococcales bacterium]|nr:efflux RND transporter permease subunit [Myxococcales bacterium]
MQWLAAVCVRRPVFTWVLMLALVVVGVASIRGLGVDRFPKIDFPVVLVTTVLPGAAPEQVESEVSDKLEEALNSISGLDELRSISYEGLSVVVARFDLEKDTAEAAQEVRDRVNRTLSLLPQGIQQPRVERSDPDAAPVLLAAVMAPRSAREVTEYADRRIRRQIESLNGVGGVTVLGGARRQINLVLDPQRLQAFNLTVVDVQRAMATQNVEVPGGSVEQGDRTFSLRVQGRVESVTEIDELVVATRGGLPIRVRDVGHAEDGEATASSIASYNGESVVVLSVRKQSGTNTLAVIDALKERIEEIRPTLPSGYRIVVVRDEGEFIRNAVHAVQEHLVIGGLLAALVVLVFLWNGRSTLISALAIPTSIIATFALVKAMGLTLNVITLLALTLAVGIVIDDAIVVLENIVRFIDEKGMAPRRAAIVATREIGLAVLATTLSLIAVFLPVAFMGGIVGRFMRSFGFTMSFAIAVSLLVSFTLTPMLSSRWLKPKPGARELGNHDVEEDIDAEFVDPAPEPRAEEKASYREWAQSRRQVPAEFAHSAHGSGGLYGVVEKAYMKLLAFAMGNRKIVAVVVAAVFFSTIPLGKRVAKNFLPVDDESRFDVVIRAPEGTSLEQTHIIGERIAADIRRLPGVRHTVTTTGSAPGDPSGRGPNQASIFVLLEPPTARTRDQQTVMGEVRQQVLPRFSAQHLRVLVAPVNVFGGGSADSAPIQYVLKGPDLDRLGQYADRMLEGVRRIPGVVDADSTLVTGKPELVVRIRRARAADLGVSAFDIANTLRMLVGGLQVSTFNEGSEQFEVWVRATPQARSQMASIENVSVPTNVPGRTVLLRDVTETRESTGPSSIQRLGRQRMVTIYCNIVPGTSEASVIAEFERVKQGLSLDAGFTGEIAGRSKELGRAGQNFAVAFILSLVFMYLVLAAQFESWIHPVTILLSLPLSVPFALFSLVMLGQSLNIFSMLGILVLFGIVKKNSILQIDHIRALRRQGLSRADAIMIGNRDRLRPILMTTVAFVAGMIPLAVSTGAGSGTNRAMSSVIIGGQTLSLLLTLIATPVVFSIFDDLANSTRLKALARVLTFPIRAIDGLFTSKAPDGHAAAPVYDPLDDAEQTREHNIPPRR